MSQTIEDITLTRNRQSPHYNNTTTTQTKPPDITYPLEYCNEQKAHIISMTETKWPESTTPYILLTNPLYKIYIANCDAETAIQREPSMRMAFVLYQDLQLYIYNIDKVPRMAIMIDLYFPQNHKTSIISMHLLSSVSKHSNHIQKSMINWIQNAHSRQFDIIVIESGLISLLDFNDIEEHTWSRDNSKSQINDIWTSYSILLDVSEPKLSTSDESTKSDHKILSIKWNTRISLKTGYDFIKKIEELQLYSSIIQDENHLNKYWNT
ncbi:11098_t:CDS:2 [Gigaspora margarita]|uniref:11098_t:CDS:1 n=1 Tax=Gigaspora margarita TaxID=4874 RepID=A0ABM8W169_GIGMA|nr:11098_t:CDS:2 [Gigaspora margarita]